MSPRRTQHAYVVTLRHGRMRVTTGRERVVIYSYDTASYLLNPERVRTVAAIYAPQSCYRRVEEYFEARRGMAVNEASPVPPPVTPFRNWVRDYQPSHAAVWQEEMDAMLAETREQIARRLREQAAIVPMGEEFPPPAYQWNTRVSRHYTDEYRAYINLLTTPAPATPSLDDFLDFTAPTAQEGFFGDAHDAGVP